MSKNFSDLLNKVNEFPIKKLSVAAANDDEVIEAVAMAHDRKIADSILVGDKDQIESICKSLSVDPSIFEIKDIKDPIEAAHEAVRIVHDGEADMYMKGLLSTKDFLKSILDKEVGLRTERLLSHVCVFEIKGIPQLLFLADVAFLPYPTLEQKVGIIENTVEICNACGIDMPKVAPVAAVEVVNEKMPATVEAAELTKMNDEGKIKGCIVDGPLSVDLAIYPEAAKHKHAEDRKIVGDADVILFPDIHAGNIAYKFIVHTTEFKNACILTGTKAPAILTSRSDSAETKVNSIALAAVTAAYTSKKN
ncbi:MAG: phosphate butyryltransferase [Lachnospiraceae bacterium]|nr:phosphate butyryltransferase [Lachnospiraceae bacterium]MCR5409685.1 phosphate butyryltransferase [Lachnospiraceae bacterium]